MPNLAEKKERISGAVECKHLQEPKRVRVKPLMGCSFAPFRKRQRNDLFRQRDFLLRVRLNKLPTKRARINLHLMISLHLRSAFLLITNLRDITKDTRKLARLLNWIIFVGFFFF